MTGFSFRVPPRLKLFLSYYKPYRKLLVADLFCALVVAATALLLPLCARYVTQNVLQQKTAEPFAQIVFIGGVMLVLVGIQAVCNMVVDYRGHGMGALMESDMRSDLFAHCQKLSFAFYDEQRTGQLMSRITNDLFAISELCHHGPEDLTIAVLKFAGAFIILMTINVPLTIILFLFMPLMTVYALYFNRKMNAALMRSRARIGDVNAQVEDTLAGIRVVKAFTNEALEQQKFARQNEQFVASRLAGYKSETFFYNGMEVFVHLFTITVIVVGGAGIVLNALNLTDVVTFLLYVGSLMEPIHRVVNLARLYQEGITGFNRFLEIMEIEPAIQDAPQAVDLKHVQGHIEFQNVSFRYRDDHECVLKGLSVSIKAGEYVALVGSSGVGKTTLCTLIPRFYEVTEGQILVDGQDVRHIRQCALRNHIGVVQQETYLFAGSIADNIRYGKPDASDDAIVEAARRAHAHEFIMALPEGYATDVGQRGIKLSGGQKQRLSIARVFLKNPPIIILDEATSALDNESENAVQEAMESLFVNRTVLVIAHRLSTVRHAQRILVLTENGIDEQGTHDELLALNGLYARLYHFQLRL
jgi:ATP-binding cassette subfamily B protein